MKKFTLIVVSIYLFTAVSPAQTNEFVTYNAANTLEFANSGNAFKCIGVGDSVYWAGTQYKGLYKYDTAIKVWVKSSQLTNVFINDIKRDKKGGVWIAQSGTSGQSGGASNIAGGINYFPSDYDFQMQFFSVPGTTTGGGLVSRNMRSVYVDTSFKTSNPADTLPRVWGVAGTYITSSNTATGGISIGLNPAQPYFFNRVKGLNRFPYVNIFTQGTPNCDAVGGDKDEVWVSVRQNFGMSQILRYHPSKTLQEGAFLGTWDSTIVHGGIFPIGFKAQAIFFDSEGKRWLGLQNDGLRVFERSVWSIVNMPSIFPVGTQVNNNAITEDDQGNVYFGTSNGLVVYDGAGEVTDVFRYKRLTTADGLPSNNITGVAYDKAKGRMLLATDAGIVFWTVKNRIDVSLQWDYSFPNRDGKPKGVAADGVARVYIKVKNGDSTLPAISNVNISLNDYQSADSSTRGRFKKATILDRYSEEASDANLTDITSTDDIKPKEFWFWYLAPTDYSRDSLGPDAKTSVRTDKIRVIVTYVNNTKDTLIYDRLRVVRPPTLMVHGLASGPPTWYQFSHDNGAVLYKDSPRFKYIHMLTMNGRGLFIQNAQLLISGDINIDTAKGRLNTLQGNIEQIRNMGYAANQVDYICHSMGGIMIRHCIDRYSYKFYAGAGSIYKYKNYNRGFTHKIIFVNTPHNSSFIADGVDEFIPQAPEWLNVVMRGFYLAAPKMQIPMDFIQPVSPNSPLTTTFKASDAVNNLQVNDARGGVNLAETRAKFHMITGNVNLISQVNSATLANLDPTIEYVNNVLKCMINSRLVPARVKSILTPLFALGSTARVFTFFEWYSRQNGFPNYFSESDIIVPLASEHARIPLPETKPYITMFLNSPGSAFDASHVTILKRPDVGQRVYNLLNSKLYSNLFADVIPANNDAEPASTFQELPLNPWARQQSNLTADSIYYDSTKIKIDFPVRGTDAFADSSINLKFRLKDTANLAYVNILFQATDTFSLTKTKAQQTIPIKVIPELPGSQKVWAIAAYNTPDNGVKYYIDTFNIVVKNNAPLQGFRVNDSPVVVTGGEIYYPAYEVKYNNNWVMLPSTDSTVSVSFDPAGIITKVDSVKGYSALQEGFTSAIFTYSGFADTVIMQAVMPLDSFCVNRTIAAGSFKNPATWSKGVVPDICDSVVIQHAISLDTSVQFKSARINAGASLTINNAAITAQLGASQDGRSMIDNYGTLVIQNGTLNVYGRVKHNAGSTFTMSAGNLTIGGNRGVADISVPNGLALFEAATGMASFNFSGGNLQLIDPPYGAASQAIDCPYDFGNNSTLILGINTSTIASKNTDGFGGLSFPNKIGRLIVNTGTSNGNRKFVNKKALNIKGSAEVRTGSGIIIQAPITVN